eukprot:545346_1
MNMSSISTLIKLLLLIQWVFPAICWDVEITCPNIPGAADGNPFLKSSAINLWHLDPQCFAINIKVNVENIMPNPSFISRETNIEIIQNALHKTLTDARVFGFHITPAQYKYPWVIKNNCPQKTDKTVTKYYLPDTPHDIYCNASTLVIDDNSVKCQFTPPESLTYIFHLEYIKSNIHITGYNIVMQALIMNPDRTVVFKSDPTYVTDSTVVLQVFSFSNTTQPVVLAAGVTYSLTINIIAGTNVQIKSVEHVPIASTKAKANACHLTWALADNSQIHYAMRSLCYTGNSPYTNEFEHTFYQIHSTQTYIPGSSLYGDRRRRRLSPTQKVKCTADDFKGFPGSGGGGSYSNSLHILYSNGTKVQIADNNIFPSYDQCIAIDSKTLPWIIFSVGGNVNGRALKRLAIHQINVGNTINDLSASLIRDNLYLDKPRANATCFLYKDTYTHKDYMIVVNGMAYSREQNPYNWYKDIVILNINGKPLKCPKIMLKYNVIDMTLVVTDTNDLYLFGGRDGRNAVNYIQTLDLDQVLNPYNGNYRFKTIERMHPMVKNLVSPFIDFSRLNNKVCILIFGGQNYVNNQWIDVDVYWNTTLQLYCNDQIIKKNYIGNTFTEFDKANLKYIYSFDDVKTKTNIFLTDYDFQDDGIWYAFAATYKLCFNPKVNDAIVPTIYNALRKNILAQNILKESQRNFKQWNNGYSKIQVTDMHIMRGRYSEGYHE